MKKYIFTFLLLFSPLYAQSVTAGYDVSFGIVGEIGKAEITYERGENDYTINVHAWTTGMAALLSQNREEEYISQGRIINGVLRPDVFVKHRKNSRYIKSSVYIFNYDRQKVTLYMSKEENATHSRFDVNTMKNISVETKEFSHSDEVFRFFTDNDLLSLFFNTQKILPTLKDGESKQFAAIGSKDPNCAIDIEVPDAQLRREIQALMADEEGKLITIIINQDIFQSERGELHVNFDDDFYAKDVVLKDVIMFGDIRGKRTYQKILPLEVNQNESVLKKVVSLKN